MTCTYETKDVNEAAFLWTVDGVEVSGTTVKKKNRKLFVYMEIKSDRLSEDEMRKLLNDYYNERTTVNPHEFCRRQDDLRSMIYQAKENYKE